MISPSIAIVVSTGNVATVSESFVVFAASAVPWSGICEMDAPIWEIVASCGGTSICADVGGGDSSLA